MLGRESVMESKMFKRKYKSVFIVLMMLIFAAAWTLSVYAADLSAKLPVKQLFESYSGSDGVLKGEFSYTMTPLNSEPALEGFILSGNEEKVIEYTFPRTGVYEYSLRADKVSYDGYTVDRTEYTVRFYISNKGPTVTIAEKETGKKVDIAEFTHSYEPSTALVPEDPPVKKVIKGKPPKVSEFRFRLTAADAANPMPQGSANGVKELVIKGEGEKEFGIWYYAHTGSYTYTVTEVDTKEDGYTFDRTQYSFTDIVTDDDGRLVITRRNEGGDGRSFVFTNIYKEEPGPVKPDDPDDPVEPQPSEEVRTGDSNSFLLYTGAFLASVTGIYCLIRRRQNS